MQRPLASFAAAVLLSSCGDPAGAHKIAVIGGGISGTFVTRYLAEYDAEHRSKNERDCLLDEIVVYDVSPPPPGFEPDDDGTRDAASAGEDGAPSSAVRSSADPRPPNWQGSRVASITLKDGSLVELGASIIYEGNKLVVAMMDADPERLQKIKPMGTGKKQKHEKGAKRSGPSGFGIYHGDGEWLLRPSPFSNFPSWLKKILDPLWLLWRYNFDFFRLRGAVKQAVRSFDMIYDVLNDTRHEVTYFDSPMEIWEAMGLKSLAGVSFHDFLDGLGLYRDRSLELQNDGSHPIIRSWWDRFDWRRWLPGTGCMRSELVTAMTINTYNQDLSQMNGLVGLVAYVPAGGELFSVKGGNHRLMESALHQAKEIYEGSSCEKLARQRVRRKQHKITAVVASEKSMELFEDQVSLGKYDTVILAAPLQQSRIKFLVESPMGLDEAVLHDMPLGGVHDNEDEPFSPEDPSNEHGDRAFASSLPPSATVPYASVVTTVVSNATLNASHFGLKEGDPIPRSVLVSERGKVLEGVTTVTTLSAEDGLMKSFSSQTLDLEKRNAIFGEGHVVEYVQVWGGEEDDGRYGGATPNFGGGNNSESLPFLLYDGARHWGKGNSGDGPALYYANAIESAVAAIEISAIGAKSTAKLVARRLGMIRPRETEPRNDEL